MLSIAGHSAHSATTPIYSQDYLCTHLMVQKALQAADHKDVSEQMPVCETHSHTSLFDASFAPPTCLSTEVALGHKRFIALAKGFLQRQTSCQIVAG